MEVNVGDLDTEDPDFMDPKELEKHDIIVDDVLSIDIYISCDNQGK